jgi:hypothetical protein
MDSQTTASPLTVGQHLTYLLPRLRVDREVPPWPADVFALCTSLLQKSGSYPHALSEWPPTKPGRRIADSEEWTAYTQEMSNQWRSNWIDHGKASSRVQHLWKQLMAGWKKPIRESLRGSDGFGLSAAVLELAVLADAASVGVGVAGFVGLGDNEEKFYNQADKLPQADGNGSSLCCDIDKSRARVLPKMHTPQSGLTIRSLSMHLALCSGDEITPCWMLSGGWSAPLSTNSLNLLLVPWPQYIRPSQFAKSELLPMDSSSFPEKYGYFTFSLRASATLEQNLVDRVEKLLTETEDLMGRIDAVVFPELALTPSMYEKISLAVQNRKAMLIAGVMSDGGPHNHSANEVLCDVPGLTQLQQHKHHRWCLDRPQIEQYGIGSQLDPEMLWWEHLNLQQRSLTFLSLTPWLVLSVLICEDLARPDPAGDLIRSVGPNLVIALLMDGPQIKERWSARYATTLADDPGSSVLTLTSIGMSSLSRPASGPNRGKTIALWKDAKSGGPVEIDLPDGHDGVVLSLTARWFEEFTADGRSDGKATSHPVLSGVHPIKI